VTVRSEVARAAALTGAAVALVGLGGLWATRSAATGEAVHQAEQATVLLARAVIEPAIGAGLVEGDAAAIDALDRVVQEQVVGEQVLAVRVWSEGAGTGTVLYSDDLAGIGEQFPIEDDQLAVLATGEPDAELSDLVKAENADQSDFTQLLEVYVRIEDPSGVPLLFETYQATEGITVTTQRILRAFAPVAIGAMLLLGAVGALIAWRLARRLERAQAEREQLLQQSLQASEHERRAIAADLHDGVVQDLVGLTYTLDAMAAGSPDSAGADQLAGAAATTRGSVRSLRSLLVEIYPPNLDQVGLAGALEDLAESAGASGLAVEVHVDPSISLAAETTAGVYRATREALSNVRRHARATRAQVRVAAGAGRVVLTVTDDGVGFDPTHVPADHVGLRLLSDLAASLGGSLEVESGPGRGTVLRMEVPR
jgi:signal transduction histidine kinase